jgi:LPS-assembly lipoprotein
MQRRALLLGLLAAGTVAGCGFELRKEPELHVRSVGLTGFTPNSPLAAELSRQLSRAGVQVLEDANRADVIIEAQRDQRERVVVVSTSAGQVREWELRLHLDYLLRRPDGELLLPRVEVMVTREMTYTESQALAKEQEEAQLYRSMQSDVVHQLLRRLSALKIN